MVIDKPIFQLEPGLYGLGKDQGLPCNGPGPDFHTLGLYLNSGPTKPPLQESACNQTAVIDYTSQPGKASALYFKLVFTLPKWFYHVVKMDEWVEVGPTHREYYERTMAQKQMLEGVIKSGLASAASAVSDYELLHHDLRKYKEILNYFNAKDEHSLKAMFIDQVDIHTGEGISMRSIAPRWSTIIADFQRLSDKEVEVDSIEKKLKISRAEAVILSTKQRLYIEWKKMFEQAVKERYAMIRGLVNARKKTVEEYRNWMKPYISRFKMTRIGSERAGVRSNILKTFGDVTGLSTFSNSIKIYAWKALRPTEYRKAPNVIKPGQKFSIYPYDEYVRQRFVLSPKTGLAQTYPWLLEPKKFCSKCHKYFSSDVNRCTSCKSINLEEKFLVDQIVEKEILPSWLAGQNSLSPVEPYYIIQDLDIMRVGSKLQIGEIEGITFNLKTFSVSQNILLVKLLEIACRDKELEKYIEEMLGTKIDDKSLEDVVKEDYPDLFGKKKSEELKGLERLAYDMKNWGKKYKKTGTPKVSKMQFVSPGPYETDFFDRITKQYLVVSGGAFGQIKSLLKQGMGVR